MEAVIATGGKQYRVSPGQVIAVERLPAATKGSTVEFTSVLLVTTDGKLVAAPAELGRAKVSAEVLGERKGRKVTIVKYKRRKNYRRTRGHRQVATTVRITKIEV
ncbi:MAG: 50S ribosomal protein L21 [Candidatus Rokuibacteriota bacterium]|nr:MAG: 50S ribosomal protein L21 [Candidatus Rokubacteria bacterium]